MTPESLNYLSGQLARRDGKTRGDCPHGVGRFVLAHWWLAGWHDADIALTARQTGL